MKGAKTYEQKVIALEAMSLPVGVTSRRIECPFCPAHNKEKGSLAVTRTIMGLQYKCFRAKCGAYGFIGANSYCGTHEGEGVKKKEMAVMDYPTVTLDDAHIRLLILNYDLTADEIEANKLKWCPKVERTAVPLHDQYGRKWGWELKRLKGSETLTPWAGHIGAKSILYPEVEATRLFYPSETMEVNDETGELYSPRTPTDTIVLVEDVFSAIRVHRYMDCVALLGTELYNDGMVELAQSYRNVKVALDPDAHSKAIDLYEKYSFHFDNFDIVTLNKDPKDMEDEELSEIFAV